MQLIVLRIGHLKRDCFARAHPFCEVGLVQDVVQRLVAVVIRRAASQGRLISLICETRGAILRELAPDEHCGGQVGVAKAAPHSS